MKFLFWLAILPVFIPAAFAQAPVDGAIPHDDDVRIREFYRLAGQIQDQIWPDWSRVPAPIILITEKTEYLTNYSPPAGFKRIGPDSYARPRQFPPDLLATFPPFGPTAAIIIGQPKNTDAKTSTPWLITLMHEHFHQLQYGQAGYYEAVQNLGLARGDKSGMWMLNYPFPYDKPEINASFDRLRDLLLSALGSNGAQLVALADQYRVQRKKFFALLSPDDHKYLSFQLWQEGIARYTQIKAAEAAATYQPSPEFAALPDYQPFSTFAPRASGDTLGELKRANLKTMRRVAVYSFGAGEGLLLDRINPKWRDDYFKHLLTTDPLFE